jgi:hypothetical protein
MMVRGHAKAAPPFDRPIAVSERYPVDGKERRPQGTPRRRALILSAATARNFSSALSIRTPNWVSKIRTSTRDKPGTVPS